VNKIAKNTLYNLIGSVAYLFSQWLMSILVVRLSGSFEEAGVFSIALSINNISYMISTFSVRNYQVSDIDGKFSNDEYITFRIITCAMALLVLPVYLAAMQYSLYTSLAVMSFSLIKTVEAIVDVIHGVFQKVWRLDIACRSLVARGIVNLVVFAISEWKFKNLIISLLLTAISSLLCALALDVRTCKLMFGMNLSFKNKRLIKLLTCCFPLFLHGLLSSLVYNGPRVIAQKLCGEEMLGFYTSVAIPTVIVQLAVSNLFSPSITMMAEQYTKRDRALFGTIAKIQGIIVLIALAAIVFFSALGDWFLERLLGPEVLKYADLLIPAVIGSVGIATTAFVSSIFTVSGHNTAMTVLEGITAFVCLCLSVTMIKRFGLQGINYSIIISCCIFIIAGYCIVLPRVQKNYRVSNCE